MDSFTFDALLERPEGAGTWTYLRIPRNLTEALRATGQVRVKATIDGYPYRSTAMPFGDGSHYLVVGKPIRDAIGATAGSSVNVEMALDTMPRNVTIPDDLQRALDEHDGAHAAFSGCSYSHQKEYVDWIDAAKRPETRERRIRMAIERITSRQRPKR